MFIMLSGVCGALMCSLTVIGYVVAKKYASLDLTTYLLKWLHISACILKRFMWKKVYDNCFFRCLFVFVLTKIFHSYIKCMYTIVNWGWGSINEWNWIWWLHYNRRVANLSMLGDHAHRVCSESSFACTSALTQGIRIFLTSSSGTMTSTTAIVTNYMYLF